MINLIHEDEPHEVVWLGREGNGAGFSGGWRGFSIAKDLFPNDVICLEKVDISTSTLHHRHHHYHTRLSWLP